MYKVYYENSKKNQEGYELFNDIEEAFKHYMEYKNSSEWTYVQLSMILDEYNYYDKYLQ